MNRIERIRAAMTEERLDAFLVGGAVDDVLGRYSQNRFFASGFTGSSGWALITRDRAVMVVDSRYTEQAGHECPGFEVWEHKRKMTDWVPELVEFAGLDGMRIGVSGADTTLYAMDKLEKAMGEVAWGRRPTLGLASPILEKLRRVKDETEVAALQRAINIGDAAFERVAAALHPEMTELEAAAAIEEAVKELGAQAVSFDTIVASGPWSAQPHASARNERLGCDQPIVIDMGALAGGYCSDLTRTVVLGRMAPEIRAIYEVTFAAQQAAIEGVEAGMKCVDADKIARSVIERAGYGDRFGHGLGHGVGLAVHEDPYLGETSDHVLEDGMVFTIEPGIYLPGKGGVRIEDVVVLESGKARVLSHAAKLTPAGV
jgi:Xaa-Pro aminopeptidase